MSHTEKPEVSNLQTDRRPTESVIAIIYYLRDVLFCRLIFRRRVTCLMDFVVVHNNNIWPKFDCDAYIYNKRISENPHRRHVMVVCSLDFCTQ